MSHRKSIPVQNLLYFNNFLEFPYFYRGYKFKYIYFYNQILMFFIYTFFVNIFGFSINMLHIDYLKDSVHIYIDFLNVAYRIRVGKVYNKKKYIYIHRRHFLLSIFRYSGGVVHKWFDRFLYMMFLFHKSSCYLAYRNHINCVCMYSRYSNYVYSLCKINMPRLRVFDNSFCCLFYFFFFLIFMQGCFDFGFYIYWFYCFFAYIFSFVFKNNILFNKISCKMIYLSYSANSAEYLYNDPVIVHLRLLDFIYIYNTFYINIRSNARFLLYYLKYFFIFLFYNFIFFNKCWNFCFFFFNYFKCMCYCWPSIKLYTILREWKGLTFYSKELLINNITKCKNIFNSVLYIFCFKRDMRGLFNSYALSKYTFFKFDFISILFVFNTFFINLFFVFNYFIYNHKFLFFKYKALWDTFGMITSRGDYMFGTYMHNVVNSDEYAFLSSRKFYKRLKRFRFKSKLYRSSAYMHTFITAYLRLCQECFFRRFNYVGFLFKKFFNLNTFTITFFKKYSCGIFNKINFYFIFYFIYKVEFIFQLLVQCGCKDLFFYYLSFFFKNWYFLNNYFFKFSYCINTTVIAVNKKKNKKLNVNNNFFFFSKKFSIYFCKYFGKRLHNILFFFSKKKLKYLYSFSMFGFFYYKWYYLDKLSVFDNFRYQKIAWKHAREHYIYNIYNNVIYLCKTHISTQLMNKCILLWSGCGKAFSRFKVVSCDFGNVVIKLVNSIICNQICRHYIHNEDVLYRQSLLLLSNLKFQIHCNFSELYVYSFLLEFNLRFLKGLSLLFCFFHFNLDFFFKFYINIYFMNYIYFCEFFNYIFRINLLFNFYFLKLHLSDYRFCGFLGLYLLIFKFSKDYINVTGAYVLNYIFDIFFKVFMTNRYRSIKYILRTLSNLFMDFLDLHKFCGFNFKIKGRMSKRTQRKQCFIINRGVLKLTENKGNLFSGKRTLSTHIGSVSIYLYINMKVC